MTATSVTTIAYCLYGIVCIVCVRPQTITRASLYHKTFLCGFVLNCSHNTGLYTDFRLLFYSSKGSHYTRHKSVISLVVYKKKAMSQSFILHNMAKNICRCGGDTDKPCLEKNERTRGF